MTTSINIPKRKQPAHGSPPSSLSSLSSSSQTPGSTPSSPFQDEGRREGKKAERRVSLLSSSLSAQEHTVINIGHPDGPPRLITCVRSSQGFDWNQEIFLPSHSDHLSLSPDLERKKDPVHEIVLTDDEITGIFPQ